MLTKRLEWFVENKKILSSNTVGFRRAHSSVDNVTRLVCQIQLGFTVNEPTLACFIDMINAYNNILINKIIEILDQLSVGRRLCLYLWSFLSERRLTIKCDSGELVRWTDRGLCQGDPISPLLFNIVTHHISKSINSVMISQYADDFAFYITSNNLSYSTAVMQEAIDNLLTMLENIGLEVSVEKTKLCMFSRGRKRRTQICIKINEKSLNLEENVKYLGVWLDRSLKWKKHIDELFAKTCKTLNILKILAGSGWGVHPIHLRRLYISLIRSRLDYCCFLYDSSANTHLLRLDKLQNQSLRVIGGFIRSTPIHVMESETCIPPLHLRRQFLAYKFCLKSLSKTKNNTTQLLDRLHVSVSNKYWQNRKKPLLSYVYSTVKNDKIHSSNPLLMYSSDSWISNINIKEVIKTNIDCIKTNKRNYNNDILKNNLIEELNNEYDDWIKIFTDGSKTSNSIGAAWYDSRYRIHESFNILSKVSIMTAELFAISQALSHIDTNNYKRVVIFSDSKSGLQHLARCISGFRGLSIAYSILFKISEFNKKNVIVKLQWIPSHIGIAGNEKADMLAKSACFEGSQIYIVPNFTEFFGKYKEKCYAEWKEYFDRRSLEKGLWYKVMVYQPPRVPWYMHNTISRHQIKVAHRLRSGHMPLRKFGFLMKKSDSENCLTCNMAEDVTHILMECVRNEASRIKLCAELGLDRLDLCTIFNILASPASQEARSMYKFVMSSLSARN